VVVGNVIVALFVVFVDFGRCSMIVDMARIDLKRS
jgi:hypothetical protein